MTRTRQGCALVVEASTPIGAAVAANLASAGWPVALQYSDDEWAAERLARAIESAGGTALAMRGSCASPRTVDRLFTSIEERWGPALVLVNASGISDPVPARRQTCWPVREAANLAKAVYVLRRSLAPMRTARFGRLVNIARSGGGPGREPSSLRGLRDVTDMAAHAAAPYGITVNIVALSRRDGRPRMSDGPSPADVASRIRLLTSTRASDVTARVISVDWPIAAQVLR